MKVLVVDDYQSNTSILEKFLSIKGFDVFVCNKGIDCLELIERNRWDAILLDLAMPEFSGFDILENLEKNNTLKNQNIILFTASIIPDHDLDALLAKDGINCCLRKPGTLSGVLEVLTA